MFSPFLQALGPIATYWSDVEYSNCCTSALAKWNPSSEKWTDVTQITKHVIVRTEIRSQISWFKVWCFSLTELSIYIANSLIPIFFFQGTLISTAAIITHYLDSKETDKSGKPLLFAWKLSQMAPATKGKKLVYHTREPESLHLFLSLPRLFLPTKEDFKWLL